MKANNEKFSMFIPIQLEKAGEGEDRYKNMKFKGIASSPNFGRDKENQVLDPTGFDLNQFLSEGLINYHHKWKDKPTAIIGEPTAARITKNNEMYVEGVLYPSSQMARDVYDLAEIMENDSSNRRMGFSIEGIPLKKDPKDPNRIIKAKITHLAITPSPICSGTRMEIMKGGIDDIEYDLQEGSEYIVDIVSKEGIRYRVTNNLEIIKGEDSDKLSKAMTAGHVTGTDTTNQSLTQEPLKEESVEGKKKKKKVKTLEEGEFFTKGEIVSNFFSILNLDTDSAMKVYDIAEHYQRQLTPDMADTKISKEAIEKAWTVLGLNKAEQSTEGAASEQATGGANEGADGATAQEDADTIAKAEKCDMIKAEWQALLSKAEELKKQAAEVNITLDGGLLGDPNGGQVTQKSEDSTILAQSATIQPMITEEFSKGLDEKFTALGTLIQEKNQENEELKKANEELTAQVIEIGKVTQALNKRLNLIADQPVDRKSITTATYKDKFIEKGGDGNAQTRVLSLSRPSDREELANACFEKAFVGNRVVDKEFAKAVEYVEMTHSLGGTNEEAQMLASRILKELNIKVVKG